jgi:hypothetical protein
VTAVVRSFAVTLALSAMLLRAVLPAGWMPNVTGVGGAALVICSVDGTHHLPSQDPTRSQHDDHMCPFAAVAHLAPPQLPPAVAQPSAVAALAPHFDAPLAVSHLHDPGHAPRGPPVSV